jgi:23S rRNA (adenine2030-N6)-methyltransferase
MNYRHGFHAGNFADVIKHALLARILVHLAAKPAAFRVIDTHAGAGRYDLRAAEAARTGEWRDGIGRLWNARLEPAVRDLLAPYLAVVAQFNRGEHLIAYPGSPEIIRAHLRPRDRLLACELEPHAAAALARNLAGDERVKAIAIDGWTALKAYVPPKERRGMVLVDPAFEQPGELARMADMFAAAYRKWPSGIYVLWYPIKRPEESDGFAPRVRDAGVAKALRLELAVAPLQAGAPLGACGLVVVNPPWRLEEEAASLLTALAAVLARSARAATKLDWIAREN